jgi:hypothetical protein
MFILGSSGTIRMGSFSEYRTFASPPRLEPPYVHLEYALLAGEAPASI